ncbi:hypothetical protein L8T90_01050 [Campylobacter sp. RKI_CA19_01121]|uniref:hypothetical protein n=1 Tax=Campylobacter sp. RKI_CA19_01121 TaxID=2911626 RepID=UPI0021E75072|nr:hypothetical protein [Campylobacter sp. RKI_CA19_01121]MCV3336563.1 hypothetical protein [Campylobacter sp. RKI_CA19_01121]
MTAYVHIGTEKTGTTSIQDFLLQNHDYLVKQGYLYPKNYLIGKQHWWLADLAHEMTINKINDFREINLNKNYSLVFEEINQHQSKIFVFSSEAICRNCFSKVHVSNLSNIFKILGFDEVFIILYIREISEFVSSYSVQNIQGWAHFNTDKITPNIHPRIYSFNIKRIIEDFSEVFGKENLIVRLFDKNEFYKGDLLKDFICSIGLKWDKNLIIPPKQNESLDLLGVELQRRLNEKFPHKFDNNPPYMPIENNKLRIDCLKYIKKHFQNSNNTHLKFQVSKKIIQSYIDYFEEPNEWVRKEFFPHKERLFPKKDLSNYKENYELKEMKPEYWDKIAEFIADIIETKNQTIQNNLTQIQSLNQNIKLKNQTIQNNLTQIQSLNQNIKLKNQTIQNNLTQIQLLSNQLSFQAKHGTVKSRIQNQLSYKLGQAMIVNSKSILGYLITPMVLLSVIISHKQEQKIYQEKIKKDPSLKLPLLEDYPDCQEALKLKNHLSYKLGQAFIKANKTWYKGGYVKMWFEIRKLKREFKNKKLI